MKAKYGLRALASLAKEYGKGPLLISDISSRVIPVIIFKDKLMQHTIWRVFQVVITVAAVSGLVLAQTGTSSITGSVTDLTGAALPGVEITLANQETGARFQTLTNETGAYRVASLPPGIYRIEAELAGFDRLSRGPITLQVSQTV